MASDLSKTATIGQLRNSLACIKHYADSEKMGKVADATNGNVAVFGENGTVENSPISANSIITKNNIATDEEVQTILAEILGNAYANVSNSGSSTENNTGSSNASSQNNISKWNEVQVDEFDTVSGKTFFSKKYFDLYTPICLYVGEEKLCALVIERYKEKTSNDRYQYTISLCKWNDETAITRLVVGDLSLLDKFSLKQEGKFSDLFGSDGQNNITILDIPKPFYPRNIVSFKYVIDPEEMDWDSMKNISFTLNVSLVNSWRTEYEQMFDSDIQCQFSRSGLGKISNVKKGTLNDYSYSIDDYVPPVTNIAQNLNFYRSYKTYVSSNPYAAIPESRVLRMPAIKTQVETADTDEKNYSVLYEFYTVELPEDF